MCKVCRFFPPPGVGLACDSGLSSFCFRFLSLFLFYFHSTNGLFCFLSGPSHSRHMGLNLRESGGSREGYWDRGVRAGKEEEDRRVRERGYLMERKAAFFLLPLVERRTQPTLSCTVCLTPRSPGPSSPLVPTRKSGITPR